MNVILHFAIIQQSDIIMNCHLYTKMRVNLITDSNRVTYFSQPPYYLGS